MAVRVTAAQYSHCHSRKISNIKNRGAKKISFLCFDGISNYFPKIDGKE